MDAKRPWYRRRLWWAALILGIVIAHPLSLGPFMYAWYRDCIPDAALPAADLFYGPIVRFAESHPAIGGPYIRYVEWCGDLGVATQRAAHPEQWTSHSVELPDYEEASPRVEETPGDTP